MKSRITENHRKFVRIWQERLNLTDWVISVEAAPVGALDGIGKNVYDSHERTSTIFLCDSVKDEKVENVLLHEVLHLLFAPIDLKDPVTLLFIERAINTLAVELLR